MKYLGLILFWGFCFAAEPPKELSRGRVTLDDAKEYAISNNYEIQALKSALKEARAEESVAASKFYPELGVAGGLDTQSNQGNSQTAGVGYAYAQWNIFRGFGDSNQVKAASRGTEIAKVRLEKAKFQVGLEVEEAFHRYLFQKGSVEIQEKAISLNKSHRNMAKKRRKSGLVSDSDVMEFEIAHSRLNSALISLKQQVEIARIHLKKLLGEEIGEKIEPVGELQHQHLEGTLMEYLSRIKKEGGSVLIQSLEVEKANFEKRVATGDLFPELDLQVRAGYEPLIDRPSNGGATLRAMVLAKIDLFSGFGEISEKKAKASKLLKEEARLKQTILDAVTGTEHSYRQIKSIQQRVDLEEKNEVRSKKFYRSVLGEYKRGVKNSSDVKAAAETYIDAMNRRERFKYDFLLEKIQLEKIVGGPAKTTVIADH